MEKKSLGQVLRRLRVIATLTIRQVEETTGVSNAYLSQLENDKIKKPSANVLYKLASLYGVRVEELMLSAGMITQIEELKAPALPPLTKTEEEMLLEYLAFLRSKKSLNPAAGRIK